MTILLIRFSSLGDVVMATAVIEAVHALEPNASIWFLTKEQYAPLFKGDPRLERIVGISGTESPATIAGMVAEAEFDVVIDLHASLRSIAVAARVPADRKERVKKAGLRRRLMIASRNLYRRRFDVLDSYMRTVRFLGPSPPMMPLLHIPQETIEAVRHRFTFLDTPCVGFAPGAKHSAKRWGSVHFAETADLLAGHGFTPVLIGNGDDIGTVEVAGNTMQTDAHVLAGHLSLDETAAVISHCRGMVTNDSGPMHIAGAVGTPFAAVFGPTHPDLGFAPGYPRGTVLFSGLSCSPCSVHGEKRCRIGGRPCMASIAPAMVVDELVDVMSMSEQPTES